MCTVYSCQAMACFLNVSCRQTGGACFRFANGSVDIYEEQRSRWLKAPEKVTSAVPFVRELGDLKVLMCQQRAVLYHDRPHDLPPLGYGYSDLYFVLAAAFKVPLSKAFWLSPIQ
jgi:hypothetical protein